MSTPEKSEEQQSIVKYWFNCLKRAKKQMPTDEWDRAHDRYIAKADHAFDNIANKNAPDQRPVVNDLRNHIEGSRSYLDQKAPSFKVVPTMAFKNNPDAVKRAECEKAYLDYVWHEQNCQIVQSQKLDSALVRNVGFTIPSFDLKKWMPTIKYLPATDVRLDPDCKGLADRMSWEAYFEDVSIEQLASETDLTDGEIKKLQNQGNSVLTEKELGDTEENEKKDYAVARRWHIFARNDAAVRDYKKPDEVSDIIKTLKLNTPRRYIQLVEGINRPVKDEDWWPFELDHNESMITRLQFNHEPESFYSFTDYQQMERMDQFSDRLIQYMESDAFFSSVRKYLSSKRRPSDINIDDFLNNSDKSVLFEMLDEAGNPLLKELAVGSINTALPQFYEIMHNQAKEASGQNELMLENTADFKEVTALAVRFQEWKLHQRINLRLGGSRGYEASIAEDAIKMLEIAHQMVPKYSLLQISGSESYDPKGGEFVDNTNGKTYIFLPWPDAQNQMVKGAKLIKLGVDAIVGDLADFWVTTKDCYDPNSTTVPIENIRLSTQVVILPGSTRTITEQQQAAELKEWFSNTLFPSIYQPLMRFDLAIRFSKDVGRLMGVDRMEDYLPTEEEAQQFVQAQQQAQQQANQQAEQMKLELSEQKMKAVQQKADNEQRSSDAELVREGAKAEIDIERKEGGSRVPNNSVT